MKLNEIAISRLANQQITKQKFNSVKEVVSWMGAIQAQDFNSAKWALGLRLKNLTEKKLEISFNNGEILRTHVLRPTWHFVSPDDIYWMLKLTLSRIKSSMKARHMELELTERLLKKCYKIFEMVLSENFLTREELMNELKESGVKINSSRAAHICFMAELDGLICSGPIKEKKQTYSLLEERVKSKNLLNKEESLFELAKKYFRSHGPASIDDFKWWSGLSAGEAKTGLESVKPEFLSEKINEKVYYFSDKSFSSPRKETLHLLPAFDEFFISYKDRSASLISDHQSAISSNGIFRPLIILNGIAAGIWKKIDKNNKIFIELILFNEIKNLEKLIEKPVKKLEKFWGKKIKISLSKISRKYYLGKEFKTITAP